MLDFFGASLSLLSTLFFIRINPQAWSIGLVAVLLNIWLYFQKGIYADMFLESGYLVMIIIGWRLWKNQSNSTANRINTLTAHQRLLLIPPFVLCFVTIYLILVNYTDSTVPVLDALTTALSLLAQGLMCYKFIETWILWFIADAIYAVLYAQKEIPYHCLLMIIYTLMAGVGFYHWNKQGLISAYER